MFCSNLITQKPNLAIKTMTTTIFNNFLLIHAIVLIRWIAALLDGVIKVLLGSALAGQLASTNVAQPVFALIRVASTHSLCALSSFKLLVFANCNSIKVNLRTCKWHCDPMN